MISKPLDAVSQPVAVLLFASALGASAALSAAQAADEPCPPTINGTTTTCAPPQPTQAGPGDRKAGISYEVTPNVVFGAKTDWTQGANGALDSSLGELFATDRAQSEASVTGKWGWGNWQFSHGAAAGFTAERGSIATSSLTNAKNDAAYFRTGPEVRRKIDAGDGNSIEPFAFYNKSIDLNNAALASGTLGGGFTVSKPDSYTFNATAGYTESGTSEAVTGDDVTGRVSIGVPLR